MANTGKAAAIIAGGQATRFGGRDKSRLHISGQTIISRQAAVLQPLTDDLFIVATQRERFADTPFRVVPDVLPGTGVLGAILSALESCSADRVLVVACDLPFLAGPLLARLLELALEGDGAWVKTPGGAEPLIACYRHHAAATIRAKLEAGERRAADLEHWLTIHPVGLAELQTYGEPSRLLANINSPEDLSTIQSS